MKLVAPLLLLPLSGFAAIEILDQDDFNTAMAGRTAHTDDFSGRVDGPQPTPFVLRNGVVFDGEAPHLIGTALYENTSPLGLPRSFSGFSSNATLFGAVLSIQDSDDYDVEILTTSGDSLVLTEERGSSFNGFLGVRVTGGDSLLRVSLTASSGTSGPGAGAGTGNYGFDAITVDATTLPAYEVQVVATYTTTTTLRGASGAGHLVGDQVVGGQNRAFIATEADGLTLLPLPQGYNSSIAYGVSSSGIVVGTVSDQGFPADLGEPANWTPDGAGGFTVAIPQQLATASGPFGPMGINGGQIVAINDAGTMIGWSRFSGFQGGPATRFFSDAPAVNLATLGFTATPTALNNHDIAVGGNLRFDLATSTASSFGVPAPLQPGNVSFTTALAYAINDSSETVLAADLASVVTENYLTYLHDDARGFVRLNPATVPSRFVGFYDNNNRGDVSASGGVLFAAENVLLPGYDDLLVPADQDWDVGLGYIDDARRVATTAVQAGTGDNALVLLTPVAAPDLDVRSDTSAFLATGGTLDFGGVASGESLTLPLTLENAGTLELTGLSASLGGTHAADFSILAPPATSLTAGAVATIDIHFTPQAAGSRHATLSLPSNDPDEAPFVLHLTGFSGSAGEVVDFHLAEAGLLGADADPLATPHDDGVPNLLKLAFNLDLHRPHREILTPGGTSGLPHHELDTSGSSPVWRTTYLRRKGSGLNYTPQGGTDPSSLPPLTGGESITDLDPRWEKVVLETPATDPAFFSRVEVELP